MTLLFLLVCCAAVVCKQPGYMPPLGASPYTWPNIFKNMKRMDYCVDKFDFLGNREVRDVCRVRRGVSVPVFRVVGLCM